MVTIQKIDEAAKVLAQTANHPTKIILYGSYARGNARDDSDLDLLVIEEHPQDRHHEIVRLQRALAHLGVPADVVVVSQRQADEWRAVQGTMIREALTEGRVLYSGT